MYGILIDSDTVPVCLVNITSAALLECSEALADVDAEIAEIEEICDCVKPRQSDEEISIVDLVSDALDAYFDVGFGAGKAEGYSEGYRASESEWDEMTWLDSTKPFLYSIAAASILYGSLVIYHFFPFTG